MIIDGPTLMGVAAVLSSLTNLVSVVMRMKFNPEHRAPAREGRCFLKDRDISERDLRQEKLG